MTRVLMVAPWFPPWTRVGAHRSARFVRHLQARGFEVAVVHLAAEGEVPEDLVELDRLTIGRRRPARAPAQTGARLPPWRAAIDRMVPIDGWLPVMWPARRRVLDFARAFRPDVVWTTADPWSSLVLGSWVARAVDRPWVADLRDPWTVGDVRHGRRPAPIRWLDHRVERRLLARARAIVFTAEQTAARYRERFEGLGDRVHVIRNGFAGEPHPFSAALSPGAELRLRFYGRFRPLSSARRAISLLACLPPSVRVVSVGGLDDEDHMRARAAEVETRFESERSVEWAAGRQRLEQSDMLLLSTEPGRDEILPAKLFDYLAAGRPILSLGQSSEIAEILAKTGAGLQFSSGASARPFMERVLAQKVAGGRVPDLSPWSKAAVMEHHSSVGGEALAALLRSAAK